MLELSRLREFLDLQSKYPSVKDLRKYVLEPAVAEINQHTDINLNMEPQRKGRSIVAFSFSITSSEQMPLNLTA